MFESDSIERLSPTDTAFLGFESRTRPMHVAALGRFDAAPLRDAKGQLDVARLQSVVAERMGAIERCRTRLHRPRFGRPSWRSDPAADPGRHICVQALEGRGEALDLESATARAFEEPLDPNRPLWQIWILTGLDEGRRFALFGKFHHAVVDGSAGLAVLAALFGLPAPSFERRPASDAERTRPGWRTVLASILRVVVEGLRRGSATSLHGREVARRTLLEVDFELDRVRRVARSAGVTVNDLLLTLVSQALRGWLARRGELGRAKRVRALCPLDVRAPGESAKLGNRLAAWLVRMPVEQADPHRTLERVREETSHLRQTGFGAGIERLAAASGLAPRAIPAIAMTAAGWLRSFGVVVTNLRGTDHPLSLLGATLETLSIYAPVFARQRCTIAAVSYAGTLRLGLVGAWPSDAPSRELAGYLEAALDELDAHRSPPQALPATSSR